MVAGRPAAIFLNEGAASARSYRVRRAIALTRAALDADLHVTATRDPGEFGAWLTDHTGAYRTVIIAGGDGSLAGAYNVLAGRDDVALGYLPAGFGNATARLLRLPADPVTLSAVLAAGDVRPVDLADVEGRLALFAGAGWDAIVAHRYAVAGARQTLGWALSIARSLPDLARRFAVSVEADGQAVFEGPMEMLVVGTTPWYGRGLLVNPGAVHGEGRLTARVYPGPMAGFALEAVRWMRRRPPHADSITAQSIVLRSSDGRPLPVQADGDAQGEREMWRFAIRAAPVRLIGRW
jgi:diacylglycerol kinase family enzyme